MYVSLFTSSVLIDGLASERSQPFVLAIPETFAAAENAAGFLWRTPPTQFVLDDSGRPTRAIYAATPSFYEDPEKVVQTLSVWRDLPSAWNYVYRGIHLDNLKKRSEWMNKPVRAQYVLWWCQEDSMPTHMDGVQHLEKLDRDGPTPQAFNFRSAFSATGEPVTSRE